MSSRRPAVLLALVLPLGTALLTQASCAGPGRSRPQAATVRAVHPDMGDAEDGGACETCHARVTPAVASEWAGGPHGLNLVKCFVCHGSTGSEFVGKPATDGCAGCHAAQVTAVSARPEVQGCFSCHAPHGLAADGKPNPHRT
jgi:hypothetical protein